MKDKDSLSHLVMAESTDDFLKIHDRDVNLVILPREEDPIIKKFFEGMIESGFKDIAKSRLDINQIEKFFHESLFFYSHFEGYESAIKDLVYLAERFNELHNKKRISVNLELIDNNACTFHVDNFSLRLGCTYLGPGFEWTNRDNVNWKRTSPESNMVEIIDPKEIEPTNPFSVGIFKGRYYTRNKEDALPHRSPRIEHLNLTRINYRLGVD